MTQIIKEKITTGPMSILYRINAGMIPPDSWIQDKEIGGGRILGEVCHFVDYLTFMAGAMPTHVQAMAMEDPLGHQDTLTISLKFQNGSIGSIHYYANGSKGLAKEYVEVYAHGVTALLDDFRRLTIYGKKRPYRKKLMAQDKGQKDEVRRFLEAVRTGGESPIPISEIFQTSKVSLAIMESIRTRQVVDCRP